MCSEPFVMEGPSITVKKIDGGQDTKKYTKSRSGRLGETRKTDPAGLYFGPNMPESQVLFV